MSLPSLSLARCWIAAVTDESTRRSQSLIMRPPPPLPPPTICRRRLRGDARRVLGRRPRCIRMSTGRPIALDRSTAWDRPDPTGRPRCHFTRRCLGRDLRPIAESASAAAAATIDFHPNTLPHRVCRSSSRMHLSSLLSVQVERLDAV